jgi:hypothetical protein
MKILSPYFRVTFRASLPLEAVANLISVRIAPGGVWALDKSGYYEEVPALRMSPPMLGMALFLIEQQPSQLYTLEGRFVTEDRTVVHDPVDVSDAIQLLIENENAFDRA